MPLLLVMWSLSFGATSSSFRVLPLLKWTCMPYFLQMFFIVSLRPSSYGTVMWLLYVVWMFLLFCLVFGASIFNFILFIAQFGYLHAVRAFCIFVCSSSSNFLLEQMFFALCKSVLMILYLLFMAWWLSHCKYWFVWVGFLQDFGFQTSSLLGVTASSKSTSVWLFNLEVLSTSDAERDGELEVLSVGYVPSNISKEEPIYFNHQGLGLHMDQKVWDLMVLKEENCLNLH